MNSWPFLAFIGSLIFLVLFIADWQMNAGVDRLSRLKFPPVSALELPTTRSISAITARTER
jgi:hypothetical protein